MIGISVAGKLTLLKSLTIYPLKASEIMMFVRIRSLYYEQKWVYRALGLLFFIQITVHGWLLTNGERKLAFISVSGHPQKLFSQAVPHWKVPNDPVRGTADVVHRLLLIDALPTACTMIFDDKLYV